MTPNKLTVADLPADLDDIESVAARLSRVEKMVGDLHRAVCGRRDWVSIARAAKIAGVSRYRFERGILPYCRTKTTPTGRTLVWARSIQDGE